VDKENFLRQMIEVEPSSMPSYKYALMYIRDSLSDKGLGMKFVPFLMNYDKHIKPYVPSDYSVDVISKSLNAYCYTNKGKCYIKILKKDNSWVEVP